MSTPQAPVLYSFRRCPYAMRARLALRYSGIRVELREVILRNKPAEMLALSAKGTVPVLQLENGRVIDESWDIMLWALQQHDPAHWLGDSDSDLKATTHLVALNDYPFKTCLDHYKYADRHPEHPAEYYREQALPYLQTLAIILQQQEFLGGQQPKLADYALLPFIRQFAHVDIEWFRASMSAPLIRWLDYFLSGELFQGVMKKYPPWTAGSPVIYF